MIYLACYCSSCFLAYISFTTRKSDRYVATMFSYLAVLLPCVLAGARAPQIGTDVEVYVCAGIDSIENSSDGLFDMLSRELFVEETNGVLYTALLYFSSKCPASLFVALFATELLCLTPVYITIQKQELSSASKVLALFSYYCFFYHLSLNLMKQCIAVSIVLWGVTLLTEKKDVWFVLLVVMTMLFVHKTAILALLIYVLYKLSINYDDYSISRNIRIRVENESRKECLKKFLIFFVLLFISAIALLTVRSIILGLVHIKHSYSYQLSHLSAYRPKISNLLITMLLIMPVILFQTKKILHDHNIRFYTFSLVLSGMLYQFSGVSPALYRISLYTYAIIVLAVPGYVNLFKKDMKIIISGYYVAVLLMNFTFDVLMTSYAGVYPYVFNTNIL